MSSKPDSATVNIPEKPSLTGIEETWANTWRDAGTYTFDRTKTRDQILMIEIVSGYLQKTSCDL